MANTDPEKYRTYMRAYMARRGRRRTAEAIEQLGGACARCGSAESLQFDHIDPGTKAVTIGRQIASMSEARLQAELSKCQLLCAPCHKVKTQEDRGTPDPRKSHGTLSSYRYCKCSLCREAKREYMKAWRKRRAETIP